MNDDEYRLDVIGTYNIDMVEEPFFLFLFGHQTCRLVT